MPEKYILDKVFDIGTLYRAEEDKAYVIHRLGTDSTEKATAKVDGAPVAEIINTLAPKQPIDTNLLCLLDLGPLFIVVPPDKPFEFSGESGKDVRAVGEIIELSPGEALAPELLARYGAQTKKYVIYEAATFDKGVGVTWGADEENLVVSIKASAAERLTFNRLFMAKVEKDATLEAQGIWAHQLAVQDKPFDIVDKDMGRPGIAMLSTPYPPADAVNVEPFTLADHPIVVEPGRKLSIKCRNVSGAVQDPTTSLKYTSSVAIVYEKELL